MAAGAVTDDGYEDTGWVGGKERGGGRERALEEGSGVTLPVREI